MICDIPVPLIPTVGVGPQRIWLMLHIRVGCV